MTNEEFEDYLKSIGGLVNGWRTDQPVIVTNICECDEGWLQLIHDLIEELIAAGWDKQIRQIKEKFGGLRFYPGPMNDEQWKIVNKYTLLSYSTCERCGSIENVASRGKSWIQTLCNKCHNEA